MRRHRLRNRLALGACLACPRRASSGHGSVDQKKREAPGLLPHRLANDKSLRGPAGQGRPPGGPVSAVDSPAAAMAAREQTSGKAGPQAGD